MLTLGRNLVSEFQLFETLHTFRGGTIGMATMAMAIALSGVLTVLWPLMVLAIALFAPYCLRKLHYFTKPCLGPSVGFKCEIGCIVNVVGLLLDHTMSCTPDPTLISRLGGHWPM